MSIGLKQKDCLIMRLKAVFFMLAYLLTKVLPSDNMFMSI